MDARTQRQLSTLDQLDEQRRLALMHGLHQVVDFFRLYLFAKAFYWEDVFSMLVIALHTAYVVCLLMGLLTEQELMYLALAAYFTYVINAGQFILKLRAARLQEKHQMSQGLTA